DDWKPANVVGHVEPTRWLHPSRRPPDRVDAPEDRRIGRMLEVHDSRREPFSVQRRLIRIAIQEPYGSPSLEYRKPDRRPRIPLACELRVDRVAVLGAGNENTIRAGHDVGH